MINQYAGTCSVCNGPVEACAGTLHKNHLKKWVVRHTVCKPGKPGVRVFRFSEHDIAILNIKGRCATAPACGCCTLLPDDDHKLQRRRMS